MSTDGAFGALPGAVAMTDASGFAHFGDPMADQRDLAAGRGVVELPGRGVIAVTGPDRLTWLDSLTSQRISQLAPGGSAESLLLTLNGRIERVMRVVDDGTTAWLLVDGIDVEPLAAWLDSMRFMLRVEVADRTADFATFGVLGSIEPAGGALAALQPLAADVNGVPLVWHDPWHKLQVGGWSYSAAEPHPSADWDYREILVERTRLDEVVALVAEGSLRPAGSLALEALRIAAWRPDRSHEVDDRSVPHELDWLRSAVHLHKGCYRGQETVAKVHNLGHPPRRLVFLHLDGSMSVLPDRGDEVFLAADPDRPAVGQVTSVARHYELGPIALAVVKRTTDATAPLVVRTSDGDVAAAQEVIVSPGAGATAAPPRLPRLGAVRRPRQ